MKLALSGGGTGGHVYPAVSVAHSLQCALSPSETLEVLYLGSGTAAELEIVAHAGISLRKVSAAPMRGRMPWEMAANALKIAIGTKQARSILRDFRPQAVLSTGGYVSFPVALAAQTCRIPLAVYLPDLYPGWAVQATSRLARRVAVTAAESLRRLPHREGVVTGYPVRPEFWKTDRGGGREKFGLDAGEKVLFVIGASQGAHSINRAIVAELSGLLELCEVVHISGQSDEQWLTEVRNGLAPSLRDRYHLFGYLHEDTAWAMAAADLAVCRSGASTLGELPAVGLPAILVPYRYAGGHQRLNARYLERHGAAVVLEDMEIERLLPLAGSLLNDPARLRAMREAALRLARPDAAGRIAGLVRELAEERQP